MNFKTTFILIVVLAVAGAGIYFTRDRVTEAPTDATATAKDQKLFTFNSSDVHKLTITPADGPALVLVRDGMNWKMTEPQAAPAESATVSELVETISGLQSRGQAAASGADAQAAGLDTPRFKIQIDTTDGKTNTLAVGDRSGTGNLLYVRKNGATQADLVDSDVYTQLDKVPSAFRRTRLLDVDSMQIKHVEIDQPNQTLVLDKKGNDWSITQPTTMPAEQSKVTDLVLALTGLTADNFVTNPGTDLRRYGLDKPSLVVKYSTTQPTAATTAASGTAAAAGSGEVKFGFEGLMKKDVYVQTSGESDIVQVAASVLDSFKKKPLELRDLKAMDVDSGAVESITIATHIAATTQPTTKPGQDTTVVLVRRPPAASQPAPTTASTEPASKPAEQTKWTADGKDADDSRVAALLEAVHPLRVTSYLDLPPTEASAAEDHYVLSLNLAAPMMEADRLTVSDPGGGRPLVGRYNGLTFELDRSLLDKLKGDFARTSNGPAAATPAVSPSPLGP